MLREKRGRGCQEGHEGYGFEGRTKWRRTVMLEGILLGVFGFTDVQHICHMMMMMNSSILKTWMLPLEFCCNVVHVYADILLFPL